MLISIAKLYNDGEYILKDCIDKCVFLEEKNSDEYIEMCYDCELNFGVQRIQLIEKDDVYNMKLIYENNHIQKIYITSTCEYSSDKYKSYLLYNYYSNEEQAKKAMEKYSLIMMDSFLKQLKKDYSNERICNVFIDTEVDIGYDILFFVCTEKRRNEEVKYKDDIWSYINTVEVSESEIKEFQLFKCALNIFVENEPSYKYEIKKLLEFLPFMSEYIEKNIRNYVNVTDDLKVEAYPIEDGTTIYGVDESGEIIYS